jgi:hypothetical protein
LIAGNAVSTTPGTTLFLNPAPTTTQIHTGISGSCNTCHEKGNVWMGMTKYPITPSALTTNAQYTGFQTRPVSGGSTYSINDATHTQAGDCSQCHTNTNYFQGVDKPANHIPYLPTATCENCHIGATADPTTFGVMPSFTNIHAYGPANTNTNCAQCHGPAANQAPFYAIPATGFSIKTYSTTAPIHVPVGSADCVVCHVGAGSSITALPVGNGATFANSRFSHTGITSNCVACHSAGTPTFQGITKLVGFPPTAPMGVNSHIPSNTTCENCHMATMPTGLIAANATKTAPGTLFATPIPNTTQIHTGITSNCNACHEANYVWMGMGNYPISPTTVTGLSTTQYIGFQTRPITSPTTAFGIKDASHPASGDCSACHTGFNYFSAVAMPNGHIPTTGSCATCHPTAAATGDYSAAALASHAIIHTGITTGCRTCHAGATPGVAPVFAGCATQASCSAPPPITWPVKTISVNGGAPTTPSVNTHIPVGTTPCESCHLTGSQANGFTLFTGGVNMTGNATYHTAVAAQTPKCTACHAATCKLTAGNCVYSNIFVWKITGQSKSSTKAGLGANIYTSADKNTSDHSKTPGVDCINCHTRVYTRFSGALATIKPVIRSAMRPSLPHAVPGLDPADAEAGAAATGPFDHQGVQPAQCLTCHNGQAAKGLPNKHYQTKASCDVCHRTSAWTPAAFDHQGVLPGQCQVCHTGIAASPKPAAHFITSRSCDTCHRTVDWLPARYQHLSPNYRPTADKTTCVSCHITNGEIIPRQLRGTVRPKPVPGPAGQ